MEKEIPCLSYDWVSKESIDFYVLLNLINLLNVFKITLFIQMGIAKQDFPWILSAKTYAYD